MNFQQSKENIQPLSAGRNVEQLEVAINAESQPEYQEELLQQRKKFEHDIANYDGDDPLDLWFDYVSWVEQSYPKSGKGSALDELLRKCLSTFEKDDRYRQDMRFIRLFIKYIDTKKDPHLYYSKLYKSGVGTMVADLYIAWAHYYDILDNFDEAKKVFEKGLDARAAPIDQLKQIYERFQFSVGQRILRKDEYRQEFLTSMEEQRNAFTSLRSLKRSKVGSIRTGSAVKSHVPGQVRQNPSSSLLSTNVPLNVYEGTASSSSLQTHPYRSTSVVEDIQNSMIENSIEPGPWSKASSRKTGVFENINRNSTLKFAIHEDVDIPQPLAPLPYDPNDLAIRLPDGFARMNEPQQRFDVLAYVEDPLPPNVFPEYDVFLFHPNPHHCYSPEERLWYKRLKKSNVQNDFTRKQDLIWGVGSNLPIRLGPRFVRSNQPIIDMDTERPDISSIPSTEHFLCKLSELYISDSKTEMSPEELLRQKYVNKMDNDVMDETVCVGGRQSFGVNYARRSIACGRKSIVPLANKKPWKSLDLPPTDYTISDMDIDEGDDTRPIVSHPSSNKDQNGVATSVSNENSAVKVNSEAKINDEKPTVSSTTPAENQILEVKEQSPGVRWSVFNDDENTASNLSPTVDATKTEDVFAVPKVPCVPSNLAEKRALPLPATRSVDVDTPDAKRMFVERSPYPIGPQSGAIKKTIRKSFIAENSVVVSPADILAVNPSSSTGNTFKSPNPSDTFLDYSLCTQNFNVNLPEQMASTPVASRRLEPLTEQIRSNRRLEPLTEQIRAQDTQPPLKLSTIMETTEGSAHTASTKSSTQFSSPEDDDLSKRSHRTKSVEDTSSVNEESVCKLELKTEIEDVPIRSFMNPDHSNNVPIASNYSCQVEKTLPAVQMSMLLEGTQMNNKTDKITAKAADAGKTFPFPIFTDSEETMVVEAVAPQPKTTVNETVTYFFDVPPEPQCKCLSTPQVYFTEPMEPTQSNAGELNMLSLKIKDEPQSLMSPEPDRECLPASSSEPPSTEPLEPTHSNAGQFEMPSLWIKDEPHSLTINDSATEESFAIPNDSNHSSTQPNTADIATKESLSSTQTINQVADDESVNDSADESFAMPSDSEDEVILVPDDTLTETIPKIVEVQSLAPSNQNVVLDNRYRLDCLSISLSEDEAAEHFKEQGNHSQHTDDNDKSIYFKYNSILHEPSWIDDPTNITLQPENNVYQHEIVNLEESRICIEAKLAEKQVDPFDEKLKSAILQELSFIHQLEQCESAELVMTVPTVIVKSKIQFRESQFDVVKCIGHGAYGRVYSVKSTKDDAVYAVKKEMPANIWECYILKEVHRRVAVHLLPGYMRIDMAIIGNNASLLFSEYSPYGTLLDVCNKIFTSMQNHVNEAIVFVLAYQMLELIDNLHKVGILHLDLKPDNFLVMKPMSLKHDDIFIQLIDFGNAVDLETFPPGQKFNAALETKHFVCIEMMEKRSWIYQPDLYCLAGTVHSVLFGKYMEVQKDGSVYKIKMRIPRYCNGPLWSRFFTELINVDEKSPRIDLHDLKKSFHDVIVSDKKLDEKVKEFNKFVVEKSK